MGNTDHVREAISALIFQNFGDRLGKYFIATYGAEIFPIFLHNAFLVLKEQVGKEKAKDMIDQILSQNNTYMAYE